MDREGRKTGGRQKGTPNRLATDIHKALMAKAEELGCNPFEILCRFANNDVRGLNPDADLTDPVVRARLEIKPELRKSAADSAASYVYPKLKVVEITGELDQEHSIKFDRIDRLLNILSDGKEDDDDDSKEDPQR